MKILKDLLLIAGISTVLAMTACSKKSDTTNSSAVTVANISGSYKLTGLTITIPPFPAQNYYDSIPACQKDDILKLNTDLTYNYIDEGVQCSPPGTASGTWSLPSTTQIIIDTASATIVKFDGKTLTISLTENFNGISGTGTETLVKQ